VKIELADGYLRPAVATFAEAEWLYGVMADWPAGGWSLDRCLAQVSASARVHNHSAPFYGLLLVICDSSDTPIGVCRCAFAGGPVKGFQVDYAAVHPAYRGLGWFTKLADGVAWFSNQHLEADEGSYEVIDSAPQVLHRSRALNAAESAGGKHTEIRLNKADTARAVDRSIRIEE
jgi:hypothetical protein